KDRPKLASLQTALSKLAVGGLQRRFDALLQAGKLRLKTTYLVAGLITTITEIKIDESEKSSSGSAAASIGSTARANDRSGRRQSISER
ncbi:MAG: hypothetical protein P8178_17485, partial [Candidatus Thiodiazotropha sp.]